MESVLCGLAKNSSGQVDLKQLVESCELNSLVAGVLLSQSLENYDISLMLEVLAKAYMSENLSPFDKSLVLIKLFNLGSLGIDNFFDRKDKEQFSSDLGSALDRIKQGILSTYESADPETQGTMKQEFQALVDKLMRTYSAFKEVYVFSLLAKHTQSLLDKHYEICELEESELLTLKTASENSETIALLRVLKKAFDIVKTRKLESRNPLSTVCFNVLCLVLDEKMRQKANLMDRLERELMNVKDCFSEKQKVRILQKYQKLCSEVNKQPNTDLINAYKGVADEPIGSTISKIGNKASRDIAAGRIVDFSRIAFKIKQLLQKDQRDNVYKAIYSEIAQKETTKENLILLGVFTKACRQTKAFTQDQLENFDQTFRGKNDQLKSNAQKKHRPKKTQHEEVKQKAEQPQPQPQLSRQQKEKLNQETQTLVQSISVDQESESLVHEVTQRLKKTLKDTSSLELFGSFSIGTWVKNTNIDISILDSTAQDQSSRKALLESVRSALEDSGETKLIQSKTLNLLIFNPCSTQFGFNITVNNTLGKETSELLNRLLETNPIAKELVVLVKSWSKEKGVANAKKGYPSGFIWSLLVIHFLQIQEPPMLPKLQSTPNTSFESFTPENSRGLGELLVKCMEYFEGVLLQKSHVVADLSSGLKEEPQIKAYMQVTHPLTAKVLGGVHLVPGDKVSADVRQKIKEFLVLKAN